MAVSGPALPNVRRPRSLPRARAAPAPHNSKKNVMLNRFHWRKLHIWSPMGLEMMTIICLLLFVVPSIAFKCRTFDDDSLGEIVPRRDMKVHVDEEIEVYCNYNSTALRGADVVFKKIHRNGNEIIPSQRVNASSIRARLSRSEPDDFLLSCFSAGDAPQHLCSKKVWFGYAPLALENFTCVSPSWKLLNCTWTRPANPIRTTYSFAYFVPHLLETSVIEVQPRARWFVIERPAFKSRESVTILVTGNNSLGVTNFTYPVDVYSIVVPSSPAELRSTALGPDFAELEWELDHLMDAFPVKLVTELAWRIPPNLTWTKSVSGEEYENVTTPEGFVQKHRYWGRLALPHPHQEYEIRVRMHTGQGTVREQFWSQPALLRLTTTSTPPEAKVVVDASSYETSNDLLSREIVLYWRDVDPLLHNGPNFHYEISAKETVSSRLLLPTPLIAEKSFAKFADMATNVSYSFEIRAANALGAAESGAVLVVPPQADMPAVPDMFTVIKYRSEGDLPLYRLMWSPPPHGTMVRYTFFWCPRPAYSSKCQEGLEWESTGPDLKSLEFEGPGVPQEMTGVLYDRNMTRLPQNRQFGIAAVAAGGASSGIKWATCSVPYDDSPPAPRPPTALILSSRSVQLSWKFACPDKSAVLLAVKLSYCEVDGGAVVRDFSSCVTEVSVEERRLSEHAEITGLRPSASMIFSLSVVSVVGTSRASPPVSLLLPDDVPSGPPLSLAVESISNVSLSARWAPPLPALRNGELTHYSVSTQPPSKQLTVPADHANVTLHGLAPYTRYNVAVVACTSAGCAHSLPATRAARTLSGLPASVDMFSLNSVDGRLSWAFPAERCRSRRCSFDVRVLSNGSVTSVTGLGENSLDLQEKNITCGDSAALNVSIRAVGVDEQERQLPGPWNSKEGPCTAPGVAVVPWWIWLLVAASVLVPGVCFFCAKCGLSVFLEMTGPVKVPDLKSGELKNSTEKLKPGGLGSTPASGQVLFTPPYASVAKAAGPRTARPYDVSKRVPLLSQSSLNSDGDRNEDGGVTATGSGEWWSSGEADSALASSSADGQDSSSASSHEVASSSPRQASSAGEQTGGVRQRSPGPYVLHGVRPANVCEGYVAVRSDPTLHCPGAAPLHFVPTKSLRVSTPCTDAALTDRARAHQGYSRRSSSGFLFNNKNNNFTTPPHSNASSPLPAYSRHSFTPPGQIKRSSPPPDTPDLEELMFAGAAFPDCGRLSKSESLTDQSMAKQRPSSIPSILSLEKSLMKEDLADVASNDACAYSVVGKRKNVVQPASSSQGYVTLSSQVPRPKLPSFLGSKQAPTSAKNEAHGNSSNDNSFPYVLNSTVALPNSLETSANYCTLEDLESLPSLCQREQSTDRELDGENETLSRGSAKLSSDQYSVVSGGQIQNPSSTNERWAFSKARPRQLDFADEVRFVASAPIENHRGRKCSQKDVDELDLPNARPNTSDGISGRCEHASHSPSSVWITGAPSLSKQSSGYVSQEALSTEPLVISPKRLFAHSQEGKSSKSIPQEVSFV